MEWYWIFQENEESFQDCVYSSEEGFNCRSQNNFPTDLMAQWRLQMLASMVNFTAFSNPCAKVEDGS